MVIVTAPPIVQFCSVNSNRPCGKTMFAGATGGIGAAPGGAPMNCEDAYVHSAPPPVKPLLTMPEPVAEGDVYTVVAMPV
jgi:hypothetical protein